MSCKKTEAPDGLLLSPHGASIALSICFHEFLLFPSLSALPFGLAN